MRENRCGSLVEVALLFLRLGATAFGGPAAHVAMMEEEVVRRRKWVTHQEFLDLLGATNLLPGPNSTEMAIHLGYVRAGWPGLIVGGFCFIVPAALMVSALAWAYVRYGTLPEVAGLLYGVKPVIIAIVLQALWKLGRVAVRSGLSVVLFVAAIACLAFGAGELPVLVGAGILAGIARWSGQGSPRPVKPLAGLLTVGTVLLAGSLVLSTWSQSSEAAAQFGLGPLFLFFLKVGAVLFGSGYVLLAFLRNDLVVHWHWLTSAQLLDATAIGQVTPGPLFTTATFVGYLLGGPLGALVATVGIFLPAFIFVAFSGPLVPQLRKSVVAGGFLDGVNAASLALMAVVTWQLGRAAIVDWLTVALAVGSGLILLRTKVNSVWLVAAGAAVGLASRLL